MKSLQGALSGKIGRIVAPGLLMLAFVLGYSLRGGDVHEKARLQSVPVNAEADRAGAEAHEHVHNVYVCPMMCVPPMENPGRCPVCGMELAAVSIGEGEPGPPALRLSHDARTLAGIRVAAVERKPVTTEVELFGTIDYDPAHLSYVTSFMRGVIERVYAKRAGQFVRWGEPLFDIYSSDLYAAEQQLIEAMKYVPSFLAFQEGSAHVVRDSPVQERRGKEDPQKRSAEVEAALKTIDAIRQKLRILGLPKRDIDELMKKGEPTGIATVYSPMYGQIIEQNAFEGTYVNVGAKIYTLADPLFVWAKLDAYESDYSWIRKDQKVHFRTDAYPREVFEGRTVYIDPFFNTKTRTFSVGVLTEDRGGRLKPGMLVRAVVEAPINAEGKLAAEQNEESEPIVIPATAPLITGKRAVVYVASSDREGRYEGREVILGPRSRDYFTVLDGLREGELVVVNGNFKIDSSVQILAKPSMMSVAGGSDAAEYQYSGGSELMHRDYWSERMKSRTMKGHLSEPPDHGSHAGVGQKGAGDSEMREKDPATILRRRPGAYGDTTRSKSGPEGN